MLVYLAGAKRKVLVYLAAAKRKVLVYLAAAKRKVLVYLAGARRDRTRASQRRLVDRSARSCSAPVRADHDRQLGDRAVAQRIRARGPPPPPGSGLPERIGMSLGDLHPVLGVQEHATTVGNEYAACIEAATHF